MSTQPNITNSRLSIRAGWVSIFTNLALFGLKYWAGLVSGSVALIADAWHTLSDSISSVLVIGGVKLSQKPADKSHPFGHGRYELIATIIIGCLLIWVSYNFIVESVEKLQNKEAASYGAFAIIATIISVISKEGLAQYSFYIGRKTNSRVVSADGWHHRSDAISSIVILVGIFIGRYFWWADGVLGIIVSLFILYTAYKIIKESSHTILGEKPEPELVAKLVSIINAAAGSNVFPHHFHIHNYVNHKELTFHIYLPDNYTISKAHEITNAIESSIAEEMGITSTIHVEPHEHMAIDDDEIV
jgi:cation diffusion facilitator family transporter